MSDDFYKKFEDKFRGSRDLIKSRLSFYKPYLDAFQRPLRILDLGCGRGEWLEYVTEMGHDAIGVDLDENMLMSCSELNLKHYRQDVMQYICQAHSESFDIISGFHIIEHIQFDILRNLIQECFRVLKPNGLLIFETPNPENILVGTSNFYLDSSHIKPLPPQLVQFTYEYYGFNSIVVRFINNLESIPPENNINFQDLFYKVGFDYTVIGQKKGDLQESLEFKKLFQTNNELSLHSEISNLNQKFNILEPKIKFLENNHFKFLLKKFFKKIKR